MTENRWLPVDEIAEHIGVAKQSVYHWIDSKGLPAHRAGKLWQFDRKEVHAWIKRGGADEDSRLYAPPTKGGRK